MVDKDSEPKVKENLDITDELIAERRTSLKMPEDMTPWMAKTIEFIDSKMLITGKVFAWLTVFLIYAMIHEVIGRHFFNRPTLWSFDISRMLAGALFMLGAAAPNINKAPANILLMSNDHKVGLLKKCLPITSWIIA